MKLNWWSIVLVLIVLIQITESAGRQARHGAAKKGRVTHRAGKQRHPQAKHKKPKRSPKHSPTHGRSKNKKVNCKLPEYKFTNECLPEICKKGEYASISECRQFCAQKSSGCGETCTQPSNWYSPRCITSICKDPEHKLTEQCASYCASHNDAEVCPKRDCRNETKQYHSDCLPYSCADGRFTYRMECQDFCKAFPNADACRPNEAPYLCTLDDEDDGDGTYTSYRFDKECLNWTCAETVWWNDKRCKRFCQNKPMAYACRKRQAGRNPTVG
ncbi:hypothetical protein M3Y95_01202400 [Aphelenchoides besseyi]|nr:hypothetical protein M3Y95_01202400 [Aphelenchoides besseyi]